jgi:hyperosmotically inducible protein
MTSRNRLEGTAEPGRAADMEEAMKRFVTYAASALLACAISTIPAGAQHEQRADRVAQSGPAGQDRIAKEVRHELVTLPYYGVFDDLEYSVDGNSVTLMGRATRPTLKSDAESAVKRIEGVERVDNKIEVLPLSPMDDRVRIAEYHTIYGHSGLDRYALQAVPAIHIIVANGHVTLVGVVASQGDKDLAGIRANTVSGVFSVDNKLRVEGK